MTGFPLFAVARDGTQVQIMDHAIAIIYSFEGHDFYNPHLAD